MTALRMLGLLMILLGVSAVIIGLSIFLTGAANTGHMTEVTFDAITRSRHDFTGSFGPTVESELRFYAPFWIVYGGLLIAAARDLRRRVQWVLPLSAVFFAGGVGRALAYVQSGPPHPAFVALMAIELALPLVFVALWAMARRRR